MPNEQLNFDASEFFQVSPERFAELFDVAKSLVNNAEGPAPALKACIGQFEDPNEAFLMGFLMNWFINLRGAGNPVIQLLDALEKITGALEFDDAETDYLRDDEDEDVSEEWGW